eukprot:2488097-Pyramimonas_sp.AAC.1
MGEQRNPMDAPKKPMEFLRTHIDFQNKQMDVRTIPVNVFKNPMDVPRQPIEFRRTSIRFNMKINRSPTKFKILP